MTLGIMMDMPLSNQVTLGASAAFGLIDSCVTTTMVNSKDSARSARHKTGVPKTAIAPYTWEPGESGGAARPRREVPFLLAGNVPWAQMAVSAFSADGSNLWDEVGRDHVVAEVERCFSEYAMLAADPEMEALFSVAQSDGSARRLYRLSCNRNRAEVSEVMPINQLAIGLIGGDPTDVRMLVRIETAVRCRTSAAMMASPSLSLEQVAPCVAVAVMLDETVDPATPWVAGPLAAVQAHGRYAYDIGINTGTGVHHRGRLVPVSHSANIRFIVRMEQSLQRVRRLYTP